MHIDSHYAFTLGEHVRFPDLRDRISTQTCVIGAGYAGLTTARELSRKGHDVVVVEAERVGWGASGRNGGFVASGFARSLPSIAEKVGWNNAIELYRQSERGREYVSKTIDELGCDDVVLGKGWLKLLRHRNVQELLDIQEWNQQKLNISLDYISRTDIDKYVRSNCYHAALLDRDAFHIHPLKYAYALADDLKERKVRIFENSRCLRIGKQNLTNQGRWLISTGCGSVSADNVVLCTSAYGGPHSQLNKSMVPVATYVVSSAPASAILKQIIPFTGCIADTRRSGDYYRTIGTGDQRRLIWGGRITTMRSQPERLAQNLKMDMTKVYPQLGDIRLERAWSGLMGYAGHQMPIIAKIENGFWTATAFGGHGLNTTAMAGLLISEAIMEKDDKYLLFRPFGMQWSGGVLGRIFAQMQYWRLQYLDQRDERHGEGNYWAG